MGLLLLLIAGCRSWLLPCYITEQGWVGFFRNRAGDVHQLLACGADLTVADGLGRMALHEIASLGTPAREMGLMCLSYLPSEDSEMRSRVLNRVATLAPNQHKVTLAQMIVYSQAWYMLPQLVQLGLDVHWAPDGESRGKVLRQAV